MTLIEFSNELSGLVEKSTPLVLRIEGRQRYPASGIVWGEDGLVVTAHHVLERDEGITAGSSDASDMPAHLLGRDPTTDLAALRIEGVQYKPASSMPSKEIKAGSLVLALGRPGQTVRASLGMVNAAGGSWRTAAGGSIERYIQTSVDMLPGFSGGPLVTMDGRIAGMNTSALGRDGSLTIPTETIDRVIRALVAHGKIRRAFLGITSQPVRLGEDISQATGQTSGLMIINLETDGPAAKAGVLQGDILLAAGGMQTKRMEDLMAALTVEDPNAEIRLHILRGGKVIDLSVHPSERT